MPITSLANPRIKALARLADKRHRAESGRFLIEGEPHVRAAIAAGWQVDTILVAADSPSGLAGHPKALEVTTAVLARVTGKDNPQAVVGVLGQRWSPLPERPAGLLLVLDRIRDPGNLGTIVRTADACAVEACVLVGACCDPFAPECVRATAGSILHVPLARASEDELVAWAEARRVTLLGTSMTGPLDFRAAPAARPLAALMGNESDGLSAGLLAACGPVVRIPMAGHAESLNVAVAAGVLLYALWGG